MIIDVIVTTSVCNPKKLEEGIQLEISDTLEKNSIDFNNEIDRQVKEWFANKIFWKIDSKPNLHLSPIDIVSLHCGENSNIVNELKKAK